MDFENKSTISRINPDINYELRVVMCYGRRISHNMPTALVRGDDDEGDFVCVRGRVYRKALHLSLYFAMTLKLP